MNPALQHCTFPAQFFFKNNHSKATLQDVPKEAFFTADILKHNDISSGSLPFKCPSKPWQCDSESDPEPGAATYSSAIIHFII